MAVLLDIPLFGWALRKYYIATKYRAIEQARLSYEVILAADPLPLKYSARVWFLGRGCLQANTLSYSHQM